MRNVLVAVLFAALLCTAGTAMGQSIVTNGNPFLDSGVSVPAGGYDIPTGWTEGAGATSGVGYQGGGVAREGAGAVQTMYQTIPTLSGATYTLTCQVYFQSGSNYSGPTFYIQVGSVTPVSLGGTSLTPNTWTTETVTFVAQDNNAVLTVGASAPGAMDQWALRQLTIVPATPLVQNSNPFLAGLVGWTMGAGNSGSS